MKRELFLLAGCVLFAAACLAAKPETRIAQSKAPAGAETYFIAPADGATVSNPVVVVFGLKGMGVAPAGVDRPATGHFHLLIDAGLPPADQAIPADASHLHFGAGQTRLTLSPGKHSLQIVLGDYRHLQFAPSVASRRITITVK